MASSTCSRGRRQRHRSSKGPSKAALLDIGRMLATGGFTRGRNGFRADVNLTHSNNWKEQAPFDRQSATIRWDATLGAGWAARTVITGSRIDQQDVPPISPSQFESDPSLNLAPIAYRRVRALRLVVGARASVRPRPLDHYTVRATESDGAAPIRGSSPSTRRRGTRGTGRWGCSRNGVATLCRNERA